MLIHTHHKIQILHYNRAEFAVEMNVFDGTITAPSFFIPILNKDVIIQLQMKQQLPISY